MVIARRALGFKERIPKEWLISLSFSDEPVDSELDGFGGRWKTISNLIREKSVRRHQLFDSTKARLGLKSSLNEGKPGGYLFASRDVKQGYDFSLSRRRRQATRF